MALLLPISSNLVVSERLARKLSNVPECTVWVLLLCGRIVILGSPSLPRGVEKEGRKAEKALTHAWLFQRPHRVSHQLTLRNWWWGWASGLVVTGANIRDAGFGSIICFSLGDTGSGGITGSSLHCHFPGDTQRAEGQRGSPEVSITMPPASLMMTVAAARSQQCRPNW